MFYSLQSHSLHEMLSIQFAFPCHGIFSSAHVRGIILRVRDRSTSYIRRCKGWKIFPICASDV